MNMDILNYCEKIIEPRKPGNSKLFWDGRAQEFYDIYTSGKGREEFCFGVIDDKKLLNKHSTVLDVGCGVGRHSIPLGKRAGNYVGIDISDKMIEFAHKVKKENKLKNVEFKTGDWTLEEPKYDLVFSSMCPAINSIESLKRYSEISKGYCMINRFISNTDTLSGLIGLKYLNRALNNPDVTYAIISILWQLGYYPQLQIFEKEETIHAKMQETLDYYLMWNERNELNKEAEIKKVIMSESKNGQIEYTRFTKWAVIYWSAVKA